MTTYYQSQFYKKPIEVTNIEGEILVIITDNSGREIIYTWYDIIEKNTESTYINKCLLGGFIKGIPKDVLIIGFGGGAFAKYLEDHIENINITGIDIDKVMFEIAQKDLQVQTDNLIVGDAHETLSQLIERQNKYDLVLIDVYGGDGEIPEYFQEKSFFHDIQKVLQIDGVLSINFADYTGKNTEKYDVVHTNITDIFGEYYSHLQAGDNICGIYNLEKEYTADNFDEKYHDLVKKGEIVFDEKIMKK